MGEKVINIVALLANLGVCSAIMGLGIWQIKRMITRTEAKQQKQEECRNKYQTLMLDGTNASIKLGEVTAKALRDGHTNGELSETLEYAQKVKHDYQRFIAEQGIDKINQSK